jgi:uncharacterized protein
MDTRQGAQPVSTAVVTDHPDQSRYEAQLDGQAAGYAAYFREPGAITFVHTAVEPAFEGRGVASALARASLDEARAAGETVVPQCPFFAGWIRRHAEYHDLLAD